MSSDHKDRLKKATLWYATQGWKLLPCYGINDSGRCTCNGQHDEPKDVGKHPAIGDWNTRSTDDKSTIETWWNNSPDNNIGVVCHKSGFFVIDIDPRSGGIDSWEKFQELMEYDLPQTVEAYTGAYSYNGKNSRGRHIYYRVADNEKLIGNLKSMNLPGIDIKHNGYVLLAPSRHFSGIQYEWVEGKAPWQIPIAEANEKMLSVLRKGGRRNSGTSLGVSDWDSFAGLEYRGESVDIAKFFEEGIDEGSRAVDIYKLACALANKMGVETEYKRMAIETLMIRFNHEKVRPPMELEGPNSLLMHTRRAIEFVASNPVTEQVWPGLQDWAIKNQAQNSVGYQGTPERQSTSDPDDVEYLTTDLHGTVGGAIDEAARNGMSIAQAFGSGDIDIPKDPDAITEAEGGTPGKRSLSDIGNGRRLVDSFGSSIRYTPGIGWFIWNGQYWRADAENLGMQELAKKLAPIIASEVTQYDDPDKKNDVVKWANQAKGNGRLNGAIESSNSDPRVVTQVEHWDSDKNLLGVANGVVDLKTGELLKGKPELHITKRAPVGYTQGLRNVRWEEFINYATGGDKELQDWLQRAAGYTLTGLNNQDVMFLVYGPPGSGKNTFVEALVKALGTQQYSWPLDSSILAQGDGMSSSTDLYHWAELRGRRMVWVDELPESERLKENSVKKLTGSSEISARSPGEKPFTFESMAKLWVTTNHRPIITDEAMWRRLRPVPWSNVPESPDPELKAYLFDPEGALPAVLAWAVEGAVKYLNSSARDPLGWCSAVRESAEMYQKNEDRIGMFLEEVAKESEGTMLSVKILYSVYRAWSEDRGERPLTQIRFQRKLSDRGLTIDGQGSKAVVKDMMLLPKPVEPQPEINWAEVELRSRNHLF
jgi:P4 family phage/plasmid primase-like protien